MMNGKARKLGNQPLMTAKMEAALIQLRAADKADSPFIFLPDVHKHTIRALVVRDWIFASAGSDGTRYRITGRGLKALKAYERTPKRTDGLCPNCGIRPRHVYPSGHIIIYCKECRQERRKEERQRKYKNHLERIRNGEILLCLRCHEKQRFHSDKVVYDYCRECYYEYQNEYNRRRKAERRQLHK